MTSSVSIVSDIVANGHQIILTFPAPPLKFRTVGFPQYGFKRKIRRDLRPWTLEIKRMTRIPSVPTNLYAARVHLFLARVAQCLRVPRGGLFRPEALGSPGGYVVPPGHHLLRPHEPLSVSPTGLLSLSSKRVFVLRSASDGYREDPQFTPRVSLPVPSSVPRESGGAYRLFPSPPALAFTFSAEARHLPISTRRFSWVVCDFGAATFALCYGPVSCLLITGKSFYFRAFASWGHPQGASSITIRPKQSNCRSQTFTG